MCGLSVYLTTSHQCWEHKLFTHWGSLIQADTGTPGDEMSVQFLLLLGCEQGILSSVAVQRVPHMGYYRLWLLHYEVSGGNAFSLGSDGLLTFSLVDPVNRVIYLRTEKKPLSLNTSLSTS
ncbi:hypothetical protein BDB01DRAFT_893597 [Pilobolus umbonatus]|nr:hypothetical protein BDB01DRAFT_893597 [Pilobolus umbonatus]